MTPSSRANTKSKQVGEQGVCDGAAALSKPTVYVVHPIDGEGCSHTLHQNFLLPISHYLEQDEGKNTVEGVGSNEPTLASQEEEALPANHPTKTQLENTPHSLVNPELTGLTSPDSVDEGLQVSNDASASLWQSSRKMRNQLPLRYQNFAVWQSDTPPGTLDWLVGLCNCLYILLCLHTVFV